MRQDAWLWRRLIALRGSTYGIECKEIDCIRTPPMKAAIVRSITLVFITANLFLMRLSDLKVVFVFAATFARVSA